MVYYGTYFLSEEEAEDVVQDAFLELWERRDNIEMGDQISAFMYRSVYSKAINVIKHRKVSNLYSASVIELYNKKLMYFDPDQEGVVQQMENRELKDQIFKEIDQLPEKCREVFKLSYLQEMKNKEIAEILNISLRTVEAHMYKALKILRANLDYLNLMIGLLFVLFYS